MAISRSLRGREQAKEQSDAASAPSLVTGVHDKDSSTTQPTRDNKQPAIAQTDIAQLQAELAECKNPIRTLQGQLVAQPAASHNDQPATIETAYKAIGQDNPICKISRRKLTNQSLVRPVSQPQVQTNLSASSPPDLVTEPAGQMDKSNPSSSSSAAPQGSEPKRRKSHPHIAKQPADPSRQYVPLEKSGA